MAQKRPKPDLKTRKNVYFHPVNHASIQKPYRIMSRLSSSLTLILVFVFTQSVFSCNDNASSKNATSTIPAAESPREETPAGVFDPAHYATYVDESYAQRGEGYDWVGVRVEPYTDQRVRVIVRSRADKKKPTCTLDVIAMMQDAHTLQVYEGQAGIQFSFSGDQLTISAIEGQSEDALYYFCSGGATISGTYNKLEGEWDAAQVDPRQFSKTLNYGDYMFFVETQGGKLTVEPVGLENGEPFTISIEGKAVHAETGDLNSDGFPEVAVYTVSEDENRYGSVYAFSVLGGRSLIQVSVPDIRNHAEASQGYTGHDEFAIVETTLSRRFPLPDGGTRQIQYKMVPGEAMPQLVIDQVVEY